MFDLNNTICIITKNLVIKGMIVWTWPIGIVMEGSEVGPFSQQSRSRWDIHFLTCFPLL